MNYYWLRLTDIKNELIRIYTIFCKLIKVLKLIHLRFNIDGEEKL